MCKGSIFEQLKPNLSKGNILFKCFLKANNNFFFELQPLSHASLRKRVSVFIWPLQTRKTGAKNSFSQDKVKHMANANAELFLNFAERGVHF
jgi:hypothetical protein